MPPSPPPLGGGHMTGRARFRRTWFGRLVLQFEEPASTAGDEFRRQSARWHDCRARDLWRLRAHREKLGMEPLI